MNLEKFLKTRDELNGNICYTVSCNDCGLGDFDGGDWRDVENWKCPRCGSKNIDFCGCEV